MRYLVKSSFVFLLMFNLTILFFPVKDILADMGVTMNVTAEEGPIILADTGDVAGGGGTCRGTTVLRAIIESGLENGVFAAMAEKHCIRLFSKVGMRNDPTQVHKPRRNRGGRPDGLPARRCLASGH